MKDSTINVFGMDCAPCAHGISQRLERMGGIKQVEVDLNTGDVSVDVKKNNRLELRTIRKKVRKSGFTPRKAQLRIKVEVVDIDGSPTFELPTDERYRATNDISADLEVGDEVVVAGTTDAELNEAPKPIDVKVETVTKVDEEES